MKKLLVLVFLILLIPFLSAVELDYKSEYAQGETLIAKISGNFVEPPTKDNVYFYRGHVRTPAELDLAKISGEYYLYVLLPEAQNNYSVVLENVKYYSGSSILEDDLVLNFSTTNTTADFSIQPGFVIADADFSFEVQNLQNSKINISLGTQTTSGDSGGFFSSIFGSAEDESEVLITLLSGEIKEIDFEIEEFNESTVKIVTLSSTNTVYEIPVYVSAATSAQTSEDFFKFGNSELEFSLATGSSATGVVYLKNNGDKDITNITLELSEELESYLNLSTTEIEIIEADDSTRIEFDIFSGGEEQTVSGTLKAKTNSSDYAYCDIELEFIKDYISENNSEDKEYTPETSQTCDELGGEICEDNEECDGDVVYAEDAVCCVGTCEEIQTSSTGKIIGWLLIIVIIAFLAWFFLKKYRGAGKPINLLKIAKGE